MDNGINGMNIFLRSYRNRTTCKKKYFQLIKTEGRCVIACPCFKRFSLKQKKTPIEFRYMYYPINIICWFLFARSLKILRNLPVRIAFFTDPVDLNFFIRFAMLSFFGGALPCFSANTRCTMVIDSYFPYRKTKSILSSFDNNGIMAVQIGD